MSSVPIEVILPVEVRPELLLLFFFFFLLEYRCNIYRDVVLFTYIQVSSNSSPVGGSAGQPQQDQGDRALSLPKPHPSDKIG